MPFKDILKQDHHIRFLGLDLGDTGRPAIAHQAEIHDAYRTEPRSRFRPWPQEDRVDLPRIVRSPVVTDP